MARSGNNSRIPAIGSYAQTSAPTFGTDLTELANDIAELIGESFATVGALPSVGNWPGRTALVASNGLQHVHDGTAWKSAPLVQGEQRSVTTSSSGDVTIVFPAAFTTLASVVVQDSNTGGGIGPVLWKLQSRSATQFIARAYGASGTTINNFVTSLNYIAVGM